MVSFNNGNADVRKYHYNNLSVQQACAKCCKYIHMFTALKGKLHILSLNGTASPPSSLPFPKKKIKVHLNSDNFRLGGGGFTIL